jgi:glycosyltransferase involved in cell wall biosynthesis
MPYLPDTLDSIRCQTYANHEVLVWDNGSTDGTIDELQRWIPSRIQGRVIAGKPLSVGNSRAELVKMASTEFCACIDGDDINFPRRLETEVAFLLNRPEVAAVGSQVIRIDQQGDEHGLYCELPLDHDDIVHRLLYTWTLWQPTVLFRRTAVLQVGNYRDIRHEDYDLWLRLASRYKLANLPVCLVKYRVHRHNLTTSIPNAEAERDVNRAFIESAPALFGLSPAAANALKNKQGFFAFPQLWRIAGHLSRQLGGNRLDRLRSSSFLQASAHVVRRRDLLSRFLLFMVKLASQSKGASGKTGRG